jgi:hypothetical protein
MSNPVPRERAHPAATPDESRSTPAAGQAGPDHSEAPSAQPLSPIDREIARSQRASAALAASAAVARAAFTDSQLEAEAAAARAGEADIDTAAWVRTEYAALDPSGTARGAADDGVAHRSRPSTHNPVAGTFDPGLVAINSRTFAASAGARMGSPIRTRSGAQARFRQEARQAPREPHPEPLAGQAARLEQELAAAHSRYDKAEVMPLLATPAAAPHPAAALPPGRGSGTAKLLLAGCLGGVAALMAGGAAWKQGLLNPGGSLGDHSIVTASVARQVEATRLLEVAARDLQTAPPAAGLLPAAAPAAPATSKASAADVEAILAAAARVAAVSRAQVPAPAPAHETLVAQASWPPQRVAAVTPPPAVPKPVVAAVRPVTVPVAPASAIAARDDARSRDAVAQAIASAQARADRFLASSTPVTKPAP